MSYLDDLQMERIEQYYEEYHIPSRAEKYVCSSHFSNEYLRRHIEDNGHRGRCSYCGGDKQVMDMADFIEYVVSKLISYLVPIQNADLPYASSYLDQGAGEKSISGYKVIDGYLVPSGTKSYSDFEKVMEVYDLVPDEVALKEDINASFKVGQWIEKYPMSVPMQRELHLSWLKFSRNVKTKFRYTFFRSEEYYIAGENPDLKFDIIQKVADLVRLLEGTIEEGRLIYRGRPEDGNGPYSFFEELTAPPVEAAKGNRMSPEGISMFYGSYDKDTPAEEIKNYLEDKGKKIYLGEFEVTRTLKVINLCNIPRPNFWMENESDWQIYTFLHDFHEEISKPVGTNNPQLEYIPSQVFCEYLRHIQKAKDGSSYDGIVYSSAMTNEKNVVLFYDNKGSVDILKLKDVSTVSPKKRNWLRTLIRILQKLAIFAVQTLRG